VGLRCGALFSLTVIDVITAVKIYNVQGHNNVLKRSGAIAC
jgi:hypothetical protein